MRVLAEGDIDVVSGGIASKLALMGEIFEICHEGGVAGFLVGASFFGGVGLGMGFNYAWEQSTGNSFGSSLYNVFN